MAANMTTYASFDPRTEEWLRDETNDDTYRRPLFSIMDDFGEEIDPDHHSCIICTDNKNGSRWVPNNGGAWVNSAVWESCDQDWNRYLLATEHWGNLSW